MIHLFIFIYFYGFYFNRIGYIDFQFLIRLNSNFLRLQIKFNIVYAVPFIYLNLSTHFSLFHPFNASFFSLQGKWSFFTVITLENFLYLLTYQLTYLPRVWPLVRIAVIISNSIPSLRILTIWRVAGWPPQMKMKNGPSFVFNRLSPGGKSQGGFFQKCCDIHTPPPKHTPDCGMINRYFPSQETARLWHTRMPEWSLIGGLGLRGCLFNAYTLTRGK